MRHVVRPNRSPAFRIQKGARVLKESWNCVWLLLFPFPTPNRTTVEQGWGQGVVTIVTSASEKSFLFSSTRRSPLLKLWGSLNYEPGKRSPQTDFQLRAPSTCDKKLLRLALLRRICLGKLVRYTAAIVVAAAALFVIAVRSSRDPQIALPSSHGCCRH